MVEEVKKEEVTEEKVEKKEKLKLSSLSPKTKKILSVGVIVFAIFVVGFLGGIVAVKLEEKIKGKINQLTENVTVQEQSATIDVVKKVSPSVVSITSEQSTLNFFGQMQKSQSAGTGFVVSADGLIMTNKHVVSATGATYSVFTSDGKEYKAEVKALDAIFDLAFLKIEAKGLTPVELGNSDNIQVGQRVIAIGNALGQYQNTVTTGVVSAVGRAIQAGDATGSSETLENLIQTDAAINPGNSGGPLSNIDGQVIGINTAVDQSGAGIGFAIPINLAKTALDSVLKTGKISRPYLGIRYINVTKEFAARNNLSVDHGALIYASGSDLAVLPNSPASKAGLKEGDIITKINDTELGQGKSLVSVLSNFKVGDEVMVSFVRDGKDAKTKATLAEAKS
jgi:serine protease Do